jgi:hypothetical protein
MRTHETTLRAVLRKHPSCKEAGKEPFGSAHTLAAPNDTVNETGAQTDVKTNERMVVQFSSRADV